MCVRGLVQAAEDRAEKKYEAAETKYKDDKEVASAERR